MESGHREKLLLVDGSNLLFQMFFGMPSRIAGSQGKAIQGTLGFVGALLKMIRLLGPTHIGVLFDGEHENERSSINPEYKSDRKDYSTVPEEENPFSQLGDVYAALDFMDIKHTETTVCETDDFMAGYALTYGRDMEIVIASHDSDFFQLITGQVWVFRYRGKKSVLYTPEIIEERFGILPGQYADFKALTGDAADHIRGAEGIGPKTAAWLLGEFGTLENILAQGEKIRRPAVRESILGNEERLRENYRLIKLGNWQPLPFPPDELAYRRREFTTGEVLKGIGLK